MVHQWFSRHQLRVEEDKGDYLADMDNTHHIQKLFAREEHIPELK